LGHKNSVFSKFRFTTALAVAGWLLLIANFAHAVVTTQAVDKNQWNTCHAELAAKGYSVQKRSDFCRRPSPAQWTCSQTILRKYHSLELAQETCLTARTSELGCFNQVLNRNFDPYVAKRVCKIK
tara:strand:- start:31554 stop:31928 length:375 start_codon:yes stop_codon:yes gene_type:complete